MPCHSAIGEETLQNCRVEFLKGVKRGEAASIKLVLPDDYLTGGSRLWVKLEGGQIYQEICHSCTALEIVWHRDLQPLHLICFSSRTNRYFTSWILLRREPDSNVEIKTHVEVKATGNAVAYLPDSTIEIHPELGESWITQLFEGGDLVWQELSMPVVRWTPERERPSALLRLGDAEAGLAKHIAIAVTNQLTVGRLHLGNQRYLNQSSKGSHWHLGWQRQNVDPSFRGGRDEVTESLLVRARDWMSRCTGTLRLEPEGEYMKLVAKPIGSDPEEFQLRQVGASRWRLSLNWETYSDSLEVHGEELEVAKEKIKIPWFWASRCGIEAGLEDRYYLWLPWNWDLIELASGSGGCIAGEIRWCIAKTSFCFFDETFLFASTWTSESQNHRSQRSDERKSVENEAVFDVFLCYNSKNQQQVYAIKRMLEARGLRVWLDKHEVEPGELWTEAVERAIKGSKSAAVLVGEHGMGKWGNIEKDICLKEYVGRGMRVIPVLLRNVSELPAFLGPFQAVDLRDGLTDEGLDRLARGLVDDWEQPSASGS